jgi:uncharacterized membrane protein YebE (DUF533 family)
MDPGFLVNGVLSSVLGGRGKRSSRALRYLTGARSGSLWTNPATLLTAAGVAWGIYETLQNRGSASAGPAAAPGAPWPSGTGGGGAATAPVPPVPSADRGDGGQAAAQSGEGGESAMRLIRLAISAANADGSTSDKERAAILQHASAAGVSAVVEQELQQPRPLREIVAGVSDQAERSTLYVLAFTILRADEQLSGAERIYLAQLANLLGLDPGAVQQLEKDTGERIDALGDQGQLGG